MDSTPYQLHLVTSNFTVILKYKYTYNLKLTIDSTLINKRLITHKCKYVFNVLNILAASTYVIDFRGED